MFEQYFHVARVLESNWSFSINTCVSIHRASHLVQNVQNISESRKRALRLEDFYAWGGLGCDRMRHDSTHM